MTNRTIRNTSKEIIIIAMNILQLFPLIHHNTFLYFFYSTIDYRRNSLFNKFFILL